MSTDGKKKKDALIQGDWDSALDAWDQSPLETEIAEDRKTPVPDDDPAAAGRPAAPTKPADEELAAAAPGTPTAPPPPPDDDMGDDEERTVVGEIPAELLADSVRGMGSTSGLGHLLGRASMPTAPGHEDAGKDVDVQFEEDGGVVTSAPSVVRGLRATPDATKAAPSPSRPGVLRREEELDPFADLRESPPQRPAPPPPRSQPRPEPEARSDEQPPTVPPPPDTPSPKAAMESAPPAGLPNFAGLGLGGPKLLEPEERKYASDEPTGVYNDLVGDEHRQQFISHVAAGREQRRVEGGGKGDHLRMVGEAASPAPAPRVQSVAPPPPEPATQQWKDEKDAARFLLDGGLRDAFDKRAAWLAEEAAARQDPAERARIMLAVSEFCAMLQDDEKSGAVAAAARDLAPANPLLHRQARHIATRDRNWYEVHAALDHETRVAPTAEARCHGTLLQAELAGRDKGDLGDMLQHYEAAQRIMPADPRPLIGKVVRSLVETDGAVEPVTAPESAELAPLASAIAEVCRIRDASSRAQVVGETVGPYEAIARARHALAAHDTVSAARSLRAFESIRGLGPGATWLAAALAGQKPESRAEASTWLGELASGPHGSVARRLQAMRAVESGDREKLDSALSVPGSSAFGAADRVVLAALFQGELSSIRPFTDALAGDPDLRPLGWAAISSMAPVQGEGAQERVDVSLPGAEANRVAAMLGRAVVADVPAERFSELVGALAAAGPEAAAARLLEVDCELAARKPQRLVDELASWAGDQDTERDRALAAGLTSELLGDLERARTEYARAASADSSSEAAIRALGGLEKDTFASHLAEMGRNASDPNCGAVLAFESALRCDPEQDPAAHEVALRLCLEVAPDLPFATWLGERQARGRGDVDGVLEWLRLRREATQDPVEEAYDLCREAMLMVERDASLAASLLSTASASRPKDIALRALYERFSPERPDDWIAWRLQRVAELEPKDRVRFLYEAAMELERTGNLEDAAKAAKQAVETGSSELARRCLERCELAGSGTSELTDSLMQVARSEDGDARDRREARERLAELDEVGRSDLASALLWHRAILEETPSHLPSLRRIEHAFIGEGRDYDLEPFASELVRALQGPEVDAHAVIATRVRLRESSWASTRELCDAATRVPKPSLWALRSALAHARHAGDAQAVVDASTALAARADRDAESAALLALGADAYARLDRMPDALQNLQIALAREPNLFQAHRDWIGLLVKVGAHARAAEECEELARKSLVPPHRLALWYRAATLWLDDAKDPERGRHAFEQACELDITYLDVFQRLQAIYTEAADTNELAGLLERRLDVIEDPAERVDMQVLRGKVLAEVGEKSAAKDALSAALDANPDHVPALKAFSALCFEEEDWYSAEQSLIRLGRLVQDSAEQGEIYRKLAKIYLDHQPDFERAELALREVLDRNPDDIDAQERLVDVFRETGDAPKAIQLCTTLLERASTPEDKRARTIKLALIHEQVEGDVKKAEQMLDKVFKQSPTSIAALHALGEFYKRQGNGPALKMLLDRASNDARRALRTGRFNRDLFDVLGTVAGVRGNDASSKAAKAAVAALEGETVDLAAVGPRAFDPGLDDLMAPELLAASFRALLDKAGNVLDEAFPMDMSALRASPLPPTAADLQQAIVSTAEGLGIQGIEVLVSPALGPTCIPVSSSPPRMVLGASLLNSPEVAVRNFLVLRALKVVQTHGCVLSRTAPIDLLPVMAAFVKSLVPSYSPSGVDQKRFDDAMGRFAQHRPAGIDPSVPALALELSATLDNRASTLNIAVNGWGDRAALLATGSLGAAIHGIAWAGGHPSGPPTVAKDRTTWIGRNAEARDLIVFVASDEYQEICTRLGIG